MFQFLDPPELVHFQSHAESAISIQCPSRQQPEIPIMKLDRGRKGSRSVLLNLGNEEKYAKSVCTIREEKAHCWSFCGVVR